jgi:hypothetical protein
MERKKFNPVLSSSSIIKLLGGGTFLMIVISSFTAGCASDDEDSSVDCSGTSISFASDVYPIVQSSCTTDSDCHGSGSNEGPGELLTYDQIYVNRTDIRTAVSSGEMPKEGSLTTEEKNTILCWIENGASNN